MKRLVLHIGTGKTGTSSIQNFLFENRTALASRHSLFYPTEGLRSIQHFGEVIHAHYPVTEWLLKKDGAQLSKLVEVLAANQASTCVISSETLYHALKAPDIAYTAEIFKEFDVRVLCYVRRQDLYMESAWKQQAKVGEMRMPFPLFLKRHTEAQFLGEVHANYYEMLRPWSETFGKNSIEVRVFDKSQWVNADLIDDFLTASSPAKLEDACRLPKPVATNLAIPTELIRILRKSNEMKLVPRQDQQNFAAYLQSLRTYKDPPLLGIADRTAIMKNYAASNLQLFDEYMHRMPPSCFKEPPIEEGTVKGGPPVPLDNSAVLSLVAAWRQAAQSGNKSSEAGTWLNRSISRFRAGWRSLGRG